MLGGRSGEPFPDTVLCVSFGVDEQDAGLHALLLNLRQHVKINLGIYEVVRALSLSSYHVFGLHLDHLVGAQGVWVVKSFFRMALGLVLSGLHRGILAQSKLGYGSVLDLVDEQRDLVLVQDWQPAWPLHLNPLLLTDIPDFTGAEPINAINVNEAMLADQELADFLNQLLVLIADLHLDIELALNILLSHEQVFLTFVERLVEKRLSQNRARVCLLEQAGIDIILVILQVLDQNHDAHRQEHNLGAVQEHDVGVELAVGEDLVEDHGEVPKHSPNQKHL